MRPHSALLLAATLLPLIVARGEDPSLVMLEPLSLTVSKFERNAFGKGINPFGFTGQSVSGLEILVRVTPDPSFEATPVESSCKLIRFHDEQGTDLLQAALEESDGFFKHNRPFSLNLRNASRWFGLEIRSPRVPATKANRIVVEGSLAFAPAAEELSVEHGALQLESDLQIRVGPVQLKFSTQADALGSAPHSRTNASPARTRTAPAAATGWCVQVLPDDLASNVELLLFGDDPDVPILNLNNSQRSPYGVRRGSRTDEDPFGGVTLRGFSCPGAELSRIKVRYTPSEKLVHVPFLLRTGLGLGAGSGD